MIVAKAISLMGAVMLALGQSAAAHADCWAQAAQRYGIARDLLVAIGRTESGLNPQAVGVNRASVDIGLMQINSAWLPRLQRFGIQRADLFDACINIDVGAWILAQEVSRYGYTWQAVGAYNAGPYTARTRERKMEQYKRYAWSVFRNLPRPATH